MRTRFRVPPPRRSLHNSFTQQCPQIFDTTYRVLARCPRTGNFVALLTVTNKGDRPLKDWSLAWSYLGDQSIRWAAGAKAEQEGAAVTLTPWGSAKLKPGRSRTFLLQGDAGTLADPAPGTFFLNGDACISR